MDSADQHRDAERMLALLREAGLKVTAQRAALVQALAGDPSHPTAQELYERLQTTMPGMSFATVYNTLASLADAGLVTPRALTQGAARFDPNTEPHDHAVCDRCGAVLDVPLSTTAFGPEPEPASPAGFSVRAVERVYRGLCARCH
ncbi:MAG: Fur family transcriptional regulator [Polyangiaceae bacterium]